MNRIRFSNKTVLHVLSAAMMVALLAGCMPLRPDAELVVPAVNAEDSAESSGAAQTNVNVGGINVGDAMEMGAAVATITSPSLVLRQSPDEASDVLQELAEGDIYKVIGISTDGTWVRLEALNSPTGSGWVAARSVTVKGDITDVPITDESGSAISRSTPAPGGVVVRTDGTRLRVRAATTTDSDIVGYVYDGESYNVLETTPDGTWARLDVAGIADGGWVSTEFLTFPGDAVTDEADVTVEATVEETVEATPEETVEATPEETVAPTEEATVEATEPPTEEATATPAPEEPAEAEATPTPVEESTEPVATPTAEGESTVPAELPTPGSGEAIVYTDGSRLRVRSEPTEDSEIVGYVQNGDVYKLLETSADGLWVKLDIPEIEGGGWVADIYVLTEQ